MNKRCNADCRPTFQRSVAKIEYSRPWKLLRTSADHLLFLPPKSSFGMGTFNTASHIILRLSWLERFDRHIIHTIIFWIAWVRNWVGLTHRHACYHCLSVSIIILFSTRWKIPSKTHSEMSCSARNAFKIVFLGTIEFDSHITNHVTNHARSLTLAGLHGA